MTDFGQHFDAAIAGAGPAGSSLAIRLAARGLSVALVDKAKFPRDKLCGEFISTEGLEHFTELGVADAIVSENGSRIERTVFFARDGNSLPVTSSWFSSERSALGLSRSAMDHVLVERARSLGVGLIEERRVTELILEGEAVSGIVIKESDGNLTNLYARVVIDATGRDSILTRIARKDSSASRKATQVAFKAHVRGASIAANDCEIYVYRGGYGGCNRVENGLYNLCLIASAEDTRKCGSDPDKVMRQIVFENARARAALSDIEIASPWLAVPISPFGRAQLVGIDGLLTVGDAAAFIDPFTGSGMLMAMEGSKIAAEVVADSLGKDALAFRTMGQRYKREYDEAFGRRLRIASTLRYASRAPSVADGLIRILSMSSILTRSLARATRFSAKPRVG